MPTAYGDPRRLTDHFYLPKNAVFDLFRDPCVTPERKTALFRAFHAFKQRTDGPFRGFLPWAVMVFREHQHCRFVLRVNP